MLASVLLLFLFQAPQPDIDKQIQQMQTQIATLQEQLQYLKALKAQQSAPSPESKAVHRDVQKMRKRLDQMRNVPVLESNGQTKL